MLASNALSRYLGLSARAVMRTPSNCGSLRNSSKACLTVTRASSIAIAFLALSVRYLMRVHKLSNLVSRESKADNSAPLPRSDGNSVSLATKRSGRRKMPRILKRSSPSPTSRSGTTLRTAARIQGMQRRLSPAETEVIFQEAMRLRRLAAEWRERFRQVVHARRADSARKDQPLPFS